MEEMRLNKYLSDAGVCSRREADRAVEAGRVQVNGKKAEMGQKVHYCWVEFNTHKRGE